jgi:uncharacterized protein (TIGR02145 family)
MARILFLMMLPFVCFSQITPSEDIPVNNLLKEKENLDTKRKASYNLDEIKVRWKKAALENCPGVPCVVTPPAPSFTCGTSTVTDFDGNVYETVAIVGTGVTQCWTKTNLKVSMYNDGTPIPDLTLAGWPSYSGARTGYDVSVVPLIDYVGTFGYLYNWYAVNERKLCPDGWHVPTDSDWNKLVISLHSGTTVVDTSSTSSTQSTTAGTVMKSQVTNTSSGSGLGWNPGSPGTNTSVFTALPGGYRIGSGSFLDIRTTAFFWSADAFDGLRAWGRTLNNVSGNVFRNYYGKLFGASVRCLRD